MAWWLEGVTSMHFGWVRNPSEAIFSYFWSQGKSREKIRNFFFQENQVFSENIGIYLKNQRFFSDFFTSDFSTRKSFPAPPKTDFSPKNRPKKMIFLSMIVAKQLGAVYIHFKVVFFLTFFS